MYTVDKISDWFIAKSRAEILIDDFAEPITKMKLQKLLYFAQGVNLAVYGERLFDGKLYAFDHGPVTEEVHDKYKNYGRDLPEFSDEIEDNRAIELADNFDEIARDDKSMEVLDFVWDNYSGYTASTLRDMSHDPKGPWASIYEKGKSWNQMSDDAVRDYFKEYIVDVN